MYITIYKTPAATNVIKSSGQQLICISDGYAWIMDTNTAPLEIDSLET